MSSCTEPSSMTALLLTVLTDNSVLTDRHFLAESGLSFFLESGGRKYLFDLGYSDVFLTNAIKMGINLLDLDYICLSHGHFDHTGGLVPFVHLLRQAGKEKRPHKVPAVIAHPFCFYPRPMPPRPNVGCPVGEQELRRYFPVTASKTPVWLTEDLVFLAEIPKKTGWVHPLKKRTIITPEGELKDQLLDDTALAFRSDKGLVIITGCSHAGIGAIIRYAQEVCGEQRIRDVIGGFHLYNARPERIRQTVSEIAALEPASLHPCHCTGLAAMIALAARVPVHETGVGLKLAY